MTVCGCGRDHEADRSTAVNQWEHEKLTGTTLAGDPLLDVGGSGRHYGGTACHGSCCDPPSADDLAEFHRAEAFEIGNRRAERQVAEWRGRVPRPEPERDDPTSILDEPFVPAWQQAAAGRLDEIADVMQQIVEHAQDPDYGRTSIAGVSTLGDDDVWCEPCGRAHPMLVPLFDRRFVPPAGWQEISIVSVGLDPAGAVVEIAVQFDNGPTMFATPEALAALGVTVSVS